METRVLRFRPDRFDPEQLEPAAEALRRGGLVVFPTETVYGIGANLDCPEAVRRLYALKGRPEKKPLTLHLPGRESVERHIASMPLPARRLARRFWPGPLTLLLLDRKGEKIGIRVPRDPIAQPLLERAKCRVGATSANRSGEEPITDGEKAVHEFSGKVDVIVSAGPARLRGSSTVVDATGRRLRIFRRGVIHEQLIAEHDYVGYLFVCTGNTCRSPMAEWIWRTLLARQMDIPPGRIEEAGFRVRSAGTAAVEGQDMAPNARTVLEELGYQPRPHVARRLEPALVEESDHIYAMTEEHLERIVRTDPSASARAELLDPDGGRIEDPIWGEKEVYRRCARRIEEILRRRADELEPVIS